MDATRIILDPTKQLLDSEFIVDTKEEWVTVPLKCQDFSVSTALVACNHTGDVAGWGKMYVFEGAQLTEN